MPISAKLAWVYFVCPRRWRLCSWWQFSLWCTCPEVVKGISKYTSSGSSCQCRCVIAGVWVTIIQYCCASPFVSIYLMWLHERTATVAAYSRGCILEVAISWAKAVVGWALHGSLAIIFFLSMACLIYLRACYEPSSNLDFPFFLHDFLLFSQCLRGDHTLHQWMCTLMAYKIFWMMLEIVDVTICSKHF